MVKLQILGNNIFELSIKVETEEKLKLEKIQNSIVIRNVDSKPNGFVLIRCNLLTKYTDLEDKPLGQFLIGEEIIVKSEETEAENMAKEWEKEKKLPAKMEKELLQAINTLCIYDMQFFTNKMRFPPSTGFNFEVKKEQKKK